MSLTTPDKIRKRNLYCKAPTFRFYLLYDKICREDIVVHAYRLARQCRGAGRGWDALARIEEQGLEVWLRGLRSDTDLIRYGG